MKVFLFFLFLQFTIIQNLAAQNIYCIRDGATGNNDGSDWANAYSAIPSDMERGAVYYLADGNYGSYIFDDEESEGTYITIYKATALEHGTENGWNDSYGDGQAVFTENLHFRTSYYIFDGKTGIGKDGSSYGFRIETANCDQNNTLLSIPGWASIGDVHYIEVRHTEIENCGPAFDYSQRCIYGPAENTSHITIANNYIHHGGQIITIRGWRDCLIENNYITNGWSSSAHHGEGLSEGGGNNITIRNNYFEDIEGTAHCNFGKGIYGYSDSIYIYNNVHVSTSGFEGTVGNGIYGMETGELMRYFEIHHNTISGIKGIGFGSGIYAGNGTNNKAYNNIWYNCENPWVHAESAGEIDHDYNAFYKCTGNIENESDIIRLDSDPFVDVGNSDYNLKEETAGKTLDTRFNTDRNGKERGLDGVWDRGAYEYTGDLNFVKDGNGPVDIICYPNPTSGKITIKIPKDFISGPQKACKIKIYDSAGKPVKSYQVVSNEFQVEMHELSRGVFFIKYQSENNYFIKKLIKL